MDMNVGMNMLDPDDVLEMFRYLKGNKPRVVVMSPPCTGLAGFRGLNRVLAPEAQARSEKRSLAVGRVCGQVALFQMRHGRHFVNEQPRGSVLYRQTEWEQVVRLGGHSAIIDQCMAGLVSTKGIPIRKTSDFRGSCADILSGIAYFQCDGRHEHVRCEGSETFLAQIWP